MTSKFELNEHCCSQYVEALSAYAHYLQFKPDDASAVANQHKSLLLHAISLFDQEAYDEVGLQNR